MSSAAVFDIKTSVKNPAIELQIAAYWELARNGTCEDLTFNKKKHVFRLTSTGERVPSVTQVLRALRMTPDFSFIDPYYALRGTYVHEATELLDNGTLDEESLDGEIASYVEAYRLFRREWSGSIVEVEKRLYHPVYRYAGIIDRTIVGRKSSVLYLKKNGKYNFEPVKDIRQSLNVFLSALNVLRWKEENLKPKEKKHGNKTSSRS